MKWEVRTMRSATSCSKTLIRSDWRRFWPLTFLYAFVSFFIMPVQIWNEGSYSSYTGVVLSQAQMKVERAFRMADHVYGILPAFAVINLILGVGLAMVLFGYLMKSNSVGLMHALPVTRTRQFLSHFGAGMSMLTAANLLTFLVSLLMEGLIGVVDVVPLLIWLLAVELMGFFFLAFGTLCAMATGWLLAVPVIYFGLNFVVMAYYAIIRGIASLLWTGYSPDYAPGRLVMWLTPIVKLVDSLQQPVPAVFTEESYYKGATLFSDKPEALTSLLIYALVGVAMLVIALILYRARQSETAGDAIVFPWLRPVVKYVISVAAGLALGLFIHTVFFGGGRNVWGLLICQIIMGALTFCGLEMLLRKSYKIFDIRTLLGLAALALAIIAVCVCVKSDVTGYQKRVPATEQVAEVEINGTGFRGVYDSGNPDVINAVTDLHRVLVRQNSAEGSVYFHVSYRLKSGEYMSRTYFADLHNKEVYDALAKLLNIPEMMAMDPIDNRGAYGEKFVGGYVSNFMYEQHIQLTPEQALALYRALEEDANVKLKPEDLLDSGDELPLELELETDRGSYSLYSIPVRCEKTVTLVEEYGITIPEEFLKYKD